MAEQVKQRSGVGGTLALVLGILNIIGAVVSAVLSFGAGTCGLVCCMGLGLLVSVVPALALCGSALGVVVALAVVRGDPRFQTGSAPGMAKAGLVMSALSGVLNLASLLFVSWPLILAVVLWIIEILGQGWTWLMLQLG